MRELMINSAAMRMGSATRKANVGLDIIEEWNLDSAAKCSAPINDNTNNGSQATKAIISTRRRANSSASPVRRVRRNN